VRSRLLAVALGLALLLAACGGEEPSASPTAQAAASPAVEPSGPVVLTLVNGEQTRELTMPELEALDVVEGWGGIKRSTGIVEPPVRWRGVSVPALLELVGGMESSQALTMVAKDGYGMTFSYPQLYEQRFVVYDPATGEEEAPSTPLTPMIAFEREDEELGEDEGPLRFVAVQDEPSQVIDGHWTVKWVDRLEVKDASAEWTVDLEGAVSAELDKAGYRACSAPGCHGSGWVDPDGAVWTGVPLYLVCGLVDDAKKHDAGAYDARLAEKGYEIQIESQGGGVVTLDSRDVAEKGSIVLSAKCDGSELGDAFFPLRLVGPGLTEEQMAGRIVRIVVRVR
jgi:hypothetical protein